jgi:hypothetical protein
VRFLEWLVGLDAVVLHFVYESALSARRKFAFRVPHVIPVLIAVSTLEKGWSLLLVDLLYVTCLCACLDSRLVSVVSCHP